MADDSRTQRVWPATVRPIPTAHNIANAYAKQPVAAALLAHGFARLRCPDCGFERLVAFSCKGRLCPSCWARRAADTAADLVDRVLPEARYRQWVLTFPWQMRYLLATDRAFL